jgi:dTMP kinase
VVVFRGLTLTGRFITLEGGEGVGKSTQLARLAEALRAQGKTVVTTREPGGTPGAEAIRDLLMTGSTDRWSARVEALLFAAARADHVERVIRPALERGDWVLCDRFIDSTRAYQGGAGGVSDDEIMGLHGFGSGGLLPDRALLMWLPLEEAASRAHDRDKGRGDRFGEKGGVYHARLTVAFENIALAEPDRFSIVDANGAADVVTERLLAAIDDLL